MSLITSDDWQKTFLDDGWRKVAKYNAVEIAYWDGETYYEFRIDCIGGLWVCDYYSCVHMPQGSVENATKVVESMVANGKMEKTAMMPEEPEAGDDHHE